MDSATARLITALQGFTQQYWLQKMKWDTPNGAWMQCATATLAILQYLDRNGFFPLAFVEVIGGKDFDQDAGEQIGWRSYHTLAKVGLVYIDFTYRQFEGQADTPWPLIVDSDGLSKLWVHRREREYNEAFVLDAEWPELHK